MTKNDAPPKRGAGDGAPKASPTATAKKHQQGSNMTNQISSEDTAQLDTRANSQSNGQPSGAANKSPLNAPSNGLPSIAPHGAPCETLLNNVHENGSAQLMQDGTGVADEIILPANNLTLYSAGNTSGYNYDGSVISPEDLVEYQLRADLEAYGHDRSFCSSLLAAHDDQTHVLSPSEQRNIQLRILDIGHQMRQITHRLQLMHASRLSWARNSAANGNANDGPHAHNGATQWNNYPYGFDAQVVLGQAVAPGLADGYHAYGTPAMPNPYYLERRRPGRPPGSKNRPRAPADPAVASTPVAASASAKAAALASAGAKQDLPDEIRVATRKSLLRRRISPFLILSIVFEQSLTRFMSTILANGENSSAARPNKRPRLDSEEPPRNAFKPANRPTETNPAVQDDSIVADDAGSDVTMDDPAVASKQPEITSNKLSFAGSSSTPAAATNSQGNGVPNPSALTRRGYWQCTLCTSQKYLQAPAPRQPAEPSAWPLHDVSKMVTHCTRMHGEHTDAERCVALGQALAGNRGQLKYWLMMTKKEKKVQDDDINAVIDQLLTGSMPQLLRKVNSDAANFVQA